MLVLEIPALSTDFYHFLLYFALVSSSRFQDRAKNLMRNHLKFEKISFGHDCLPRIFFSLQSFRDQLGLASLRSAVVSTQQRADEIRLQENFLRVPAIQKVNLKSYVTQFCREIK